MNKKRITLSSGSRAFALLVGLAVVGGTPVHAEQVPLGTKVESFREKLERKVAESGVALDLGGLLEALAHHPDWLTRSRVARILGWRGEAGAVGGLLRAARTDDRWGVRRDAAVALHSLGREEGVEILRHEMREGSSSSDSLFTAWTLAQLGDPSGYGRVMDGVDEGSLTTIHKLGEFLRFEELNALDVLIGLTRSEDSEVSHRARVALHYGINAGYVEREALEGVLEEPPKPSEEELEQQARKRRERTRLKWETLDTDLTKPSAEQLKESIRRLRLELEARLNDPNMPEEHKDHARNLLLMLDEMEPQEPTPEPKDDQR